MTLRNVNTMLPTDGAFKEALNQSSAPGAASQLIAESIPVSPLVTYNAMRSIQTPQDTDGVVRVMNMLAQSQLLAGSKLLLNAVTAATFSQVFKNPDSLTQTTWTVQFTMPAGSATYFIEGTNDPLAETDPASAQWVQVATGTVTAPNTGYSGGFLYTYNRVRVAAVTGGALTARLGM